MEKKGQELKLGIQRLETFEAENKTLRHENTELKDENNALKAKVAELESQLNSNTRNSNRPPSTDGYKKKPALPMKKKGKQGGQQGHKGRTLQQVTHPDKKVECNPARCDCGHEFTADELRLSEKRHMFDFPQPRLEFTEFQINNAACPVRGKTHKRRAPEGVNAPIQYGNVVKTFAILLNVNFKLPFKKMQSLFGDLFGYSINESTVNAASEQCYEKLEATEEFIKSRIVESDVTHADETGLLVTGKLHWLHTASSLLYTCLFVHEKKGTIAIKSDKSILGRILGWLVQVCWSSYFSFHKIRHAICGAYILREMEGLIESGRSK